MYNIIYNIIYNKNDTDNKKDKDNKNDTDNKKKEEERIKVLIESEKYRFQECHGGC